MLIFRRLPPKLFLLAVAIGLLIVPSVWLVTYLLDQREASKVTQEQLFAAVNQGDMSAVIQYLKAKPQLAKAQDAKGRTVLHMAAEKDMADTTLLLLNMGADPSIRNADGKTALDVAVEKNAVHAEKVLKEKAGAP
jgi:ankyrin repeat protein